MGGLTASPQACSSISPPREGGKWRYVAITAREAGAETRGSRARPSVDLDGEVGYRVAVVSRKFGPEPSQGRRAVRPVWTDSGHHAVDAPPPAGTGLACPRFLEGPQWSPGSRSTPRAVASAMRSSLKAGGWPRTMRGTPEDERRSRLRAFDPMDRAGAVQSPAGVLRAGRRRPRRPS